jgi:hypothetical protein
MDEMYSMDECDPQDDLPWMKFTVVEWVMGLGFRV